MANPNFLELEWKARRAIDIIAESKDKQSSKDYENALRSSVQRFDRVTRLTDDAYRNWREKRGDRMRTFRELRRESDRIKELCDEHALDDYPSQKIDYTEEEHLEQLIDLAIAYLEAHRDEWDWIPGRIANLQSLRKQGDQQQREADDLYENYTVKVKERVTAYDRLLGVLLDYLHDARQDVSDHTLWPRIQLHV